MTDATNVSSETFQSISVSLNLINGILGYLGNQPYVQVQQLISAIQTECNPQVSTRAAPAPEVESGN